MYMYVDIKSYTSDITNLEFSFRDCVKMYEFSSSRTFTTGYPGDVNHPISLSTRFS